jgi:hypothetical protein
MMIGAVIIAVFAVVWTAAGARVLGRGWMFGLSALAILIWVVIAHLAANHGSAYPFKFNGGAYGIAVVFEFIGIFVAVVILRSRRLYDFMLPVVSIIVGLHFFGMVSALGSDEYWWIGAAMCVWPLAVMSLTPRRWWNPMTGLGCAVILWVSILCSISF